MYNTNASGKRSPSIRALIRLRSPAYLPRLTHFIWVCCRFNRRQLVCMVSWASATCVIFGDNVETTDCGYKKKQHGWIWDQPGRSYQYFPSSNLLYFGSLLPYSQSFGTGPVNSILWWYSKCMCVCTHCLSGHLLYVLSHFYGHGPESPYGIDFYYFFPDKINIYPFYD